MLSSQEEMLERKRTLDNDRRLREQQQSGGTYHQHAVSDASVDRGRYTAHERSTVIGSTGLPNYPAGPAWSADPGSQCVEPPLSFDNPALELGPSLLAPPAEAQAPGPTLDATSTPLARGVGPLSSDGSAPAVFPASGKRGHAVEPSSSLKRRRL